MDAHITQPPAEQNFPNSDQNSGQSGSYYPQQYYPPSVQPQKPSGFRKGLGMGVGLMVTGGIALVVLLICACGGLLLLGKDSDKENKKERRKAVATVALKETARDGKFEFLVDSVECGHDRIGTDLLGEQAQGQFCLVTLSVKNIGDSAQYFSDTEQKAINTSGQEFSANPTASLYANSNSQTLFTQINPGNTLQGIIVFDIPKDQQLVKLELHDSAFSKGILISAQ
jgi:hypothetical protein